MRIIALVFSFLGIFAITFPTFPQYSIPPAPAVTRDPAALLLAVCDSAYGKDIRLVNGQVYSPPRIRASGHPYFLGQEWMDGSVRVSGKEFTGLQLQYDIYGDRLIYLDRSPDGSIRRLLLNKEQVDWFTVGRHSFILVTGTMVDDHPGPQYYESLFCGQTFLLKKWEKLFETGSAEAYPYGTFTESRESLYILKDRQLVRVINRSSVLQAFGDHKAELKRYMKENNFSWFRLTDQEFTEIVRHYDSLEQDH